MGAGCCKGSSGPEFNPDGSPKEPQTKEQEIQDPIDLRKAAKDADVKQMLSLLPRMLRNQINSYAGGNEVTEEEARYTALHFSASIGHLKAVKTLKSYGAVLDLKNKAGKTPLTLAMENGKQKTMTWLLEAGADPNIKDADGNTTVLSAILSGRKDLVDFLLKVCKDVDCNVINKQGDTFLIAAARNGWFRHLENFLGKVNDIKVLNKKNDRNESVLGWVLKFGCGGGLAVREMDALVKSLVEKGAELKPCFPEKVSPTSLAAASGSFETYKYFAQKITAVNPQALAQESDALKRNALHYAAAKGKTDICKDLVQTYSMNAAQPDKQGNTPMHLAALRGHSDVAQFLMAKAADPKVALFSLNKDGLCAYHLALMAKGSETSQDAALKILENMSSDPEVTKTIVKGKKEGQIKSTPLLLAIAAHQHLVVKKLIELGHDVNQSNMTGQVPVAVNLASVTKKTQAQDGEIFDLLIKAGARIEAENPANHPLLSLCKSGVAEFAEKAVAAMKEKFGTLDWNLRDEQGRTPLQLAALNDNYYLVQYLIDSENQPVDAAGEDGVTPLMFAAQGASINATKRLLNRGANVTAKDGAGNTALKHALKRPFVSTLELAQLLLMRGAAPQDVVNDISGEGFLHRAIRYGAAWFIEVWGKHGGNLRIKCTTPKHVGEEEVEEAIDEDAALDNLDQKFEENVVPEDDDAADIVDDEEEQEGQPIAEGCEDDPDIDDDPDFYDPSRVEARRNTRVQARKAALKAGVAWFDDWMDDAESPFINDIMDDDDEDDVFEKDILDLDNATLEDIALHLLSEDLEKMEKKKRRGPGPVAEGEEDEDETSPLLQNAYNSGAASAGNLGRKSVGSMMSGASVTITDSYYMEGQRYSGMPKYMNLDTTFRPVAVDFSVKVRAEKYIGEEAARLANGTPDKEEGIMGLALLIRNLKHYWQSLSPNEFPMKLGHWKKFNKRMNAVRLDITKNKGKKAKKKGFFAALKSLFTFEIPESVKMLDTPALVWAVRMNRLPCVYALLKLSTGLVNDHDGYNVTAIQYAMYMLAKQPLSKIFQNMVDLILYNYPDPSATAAKPFAITVANDNPKKEPLKKVFQSPGVMHPLVLALLMKDKSRLLWLTQQCGGNLNTARVYLPDVPIYFNGLWEKMQVGKTECKVVPLHLAVLHKDYDLVKLLLDLGADCNVMGLPLGYKEKMAKFDKEMADRKKRAQKLAAAREKGKLSYALEAGKSGVISMCGKIKDFCRSIELPGITKPHPWINPLHLAARNGLSDMALLLVRRGALVGGNKYALHIGKSPLVEALNYARKNCKAFNTTAARANWMAIEGPAYADIPAMPKEAAEKMVKEKATQMAKALIDPTMMAIKAALAVAKFVINLILDMKKRPIAHHDPAVWCAHVLLLHRIPVKSSDTQTQIVLRDMIDNSLYAWLDVKDNNGGGWTHREQVKVHDPTWMGEVSTIVGASNKDKKSLKAEYYNKMTDDKIEWKAYNKLKAKYKTSVENAYVRNGCDAVLKVYGPFVTNFVQQQKQEILEARSRNKLLVEAAAKARLLGIQERLNETAEQAQGLMESAAAQISSGFEFDESALALDDLEEEMEEMMEAGEECVDGMMDTVGDLMDGDVMGNTAGATIGGSFKLGGSQSGIGGSFKLGGSQNGAGSFKLGGSQSGAGTGSFKLGGSQNGGSFKAANGSQSGAGTGSFKMGGSFKDAVPEGDFRIGTDVMKGADQMMQSAMSMKSQASVKSTASRARSSKKSRGPRTRAPSGAKAAAISKMVEGAGKQQLDKLKAQASAALKDQMKDALGVENLDINKMSGDLVKESFTDPDLGFLDFDNFDIGEYMDGINLEMDLDLNFGDFSEVQDMLSDIFDLMENFA